MGSNKVRSKAPSSGKGDGDLRGHTSKTGECDPGGPQGKITRMTNDGKTDL